MSLWTMTDEAAGKPKYLSDELRNAQTVSDKDATIGINVAEALDADSAAKGLRTPGWVTYTTYTDANGNVRHKSEVLVAASSIASDGTETLVDDLGGTPVVTYSAGGDFNDAYPTVASQTYLQILKAGMNPDLTAAIESIVSGTTLTLGYIASGTPGTVTVTASGAASSPGPGTFFFVSFSGGPANGSTLTSIAIG